MRPICVTCHCFFRPIKNGFHFIEGMPENSDVAPGLVNSDKWKPYKLWQGDKYRCEGCGAEIISGVAREPIREHYQPDFEKIRARLHADFQVNDC